MGWETWAAQDLAKEFRDRTEHQYRQTDGSVAWPNSAEGDILKLASVTIAALESRLAERVVMPELTDEEIGECWNSGGVFFPIQMGREVVKAVQAAAKSIPASQALGPGEVGVPAEELRLLNEFLADWRVPGGRPLQEWFESLKAKAYRIDALRSQRKDG